MHCSYLSDTGLVQSPRVAPSSAGQWKAGEGKRVDPGASGRRAHCCGSSLKGPHPLPTGRSERPTDRAGPRLSPAAAVGGSGGGARGKVLRKGRGSAGPMEPPAAKRRCLATGEQPEPEPGPAASAAVETLLDLSARRVAETWAFEQVRLGVGCRLMKREAAPGSPFKPPPLALFPLVPGPTKLLGSFPPYPPPP